jgi:hypothetical protein
MTTAHRLLVVMGVTFAVVGVLAPHLPEPSGTPLSPLGTAHALVMAMPLFSWCKADAAARGIRPPAAAQLLVGIFARVGVPYYFLRTLPFSRALGAIGKAILFLLLLSVISVVCSL